jgi:hypothetical protein
MTTMPPNPMMESECPVRPRERRSIRRGSRVRWRPERDAGKQATTVAADVFKRKARRCIDDLQLLRIQVALYASARRKSR